MTHHNVQQSIKRVVASFARRLSQSREDQSVDEPNHQTVGLTDAVQSGWYLNDSQEVLKGFRIGPEDTVIDVGCGDGLATHFCARQGAHVVFTDIDSAKVESVRKLVTGLGARRIEGVVSDSLPLPLADGYGSKVMAMEMLEHTREPAKVLDELVRVGRSGAQYLITVPDARSEEVQKPIAAKNYFEMPNHIQIFSKHDFISLVEGAGLKVESYQTWGFFWTIWWCLNWLEGKEKGVGAVLDTVAQSRGDSMQSWTHVWSELQRHPGARNLMQTLNDALPKSQAIIAYKP